MLPEQSRPIEMRVEVPTRGLAKMKTGHASTSCSPTPGVERTPMLRGRDVSEHLIELGLEDCLKSSQHKVATGSRIDEEAEMGRHEELGECGPFDPGEH